MKIIYEHGGHIAKTTVYIVHHVVKENEPFITAIVKYVGNIMWGSVDQNDLLMSQIIKTCK